ncbi:MAG: ABC transporter permease [Candidatus Micrarchaeaceae archaeon]
MNRKKSGLSQIYASILVNAIFAMVNYPIVLVSTILAPFSLLIVITFVSHGTLLPVAISGALIMTMITSGTSMQQDLSHLKNDFKLQDMIVSSPTTPAAYLLGMALSEVVYSAPALIVLIALTALYVHVTAIGALTMAAVVIIMFIFASSLGFFLSTLSSDVVQGWAFGGIVSTILSALPPVYYPITYIPMPWQYLAYFSPATYAAEIMQNTVGLTHFSGATMLADWSVIIIVSSAMLYLAVKRAKWREN